MSIFKCKMCGGMLDFAEGACVGADNAEKAKEIADEIVILVGDRNKKCRELK